MYTFMDYIQGGCNVGLILAMDFALTNKDVHDSESLHFFPELKQAREMKIADREEKKR